jgi:hypothetical protein
MRALPCLTAQAEAYATKIYPRFMPSGARAHENSQRIE